MAKSTNIDFYMDNLGKKQRLNTYYNSFIFNYQEI